MAITQDNNPLGDYLKDRRTRLDPARLGYSMTRRRTPGLRREEVAQRANVSTTWYTWLEQGREGAPSTEVLERLAQALALTEAEREHLFILAQNRPPRIHYQGTRDVTPQLQRVLDALEYSPAFVKTAEWDVVAWNRAAAVVLTDYAALSPARRNILHLIFSQPQTQAPMPNWEDVARLVVATFRAETARTGVTARAQSLVAELTQSSPAFTALWQEHAVTPHGEGTKYIQHSAAGLIALEYSTFAVAEKPQLSLVVYNPATQKDQSAVAALLAHHGAEEWRGS